MKYVLVAYCVNLLNFFVVLYLNIANIDIYQCDEIFEICAVVNTVSIFNSLGMMAFYKKHGVIQLLFNIAIYISIMYFAVNSMD